MSTRSQIVKQLEDGSFKGIYCHYDGYIENGVGETLFNHYSGNPLTGENSNLDKLLELGDLSSLGNEPVDDPNLWKDYIEDDGTKCRTYIGRGDDPGDCEPLCTKTLDEYLSKTGASYTYVWAKLDNEKEYSWHVYDWEGKSKGNLKSLLNR